MNETTEFMFWNLITFERFHIGTGNVVTSYILISLIMPGILASFTRKVSFKISFEATKMWLNYLVHSLRMLYILDPNNRLYVVHISINNYCRKS